MEPTDYADVIGDSDIRGKYLPTRLLDIPDNDFLSWADERILREIKNRENWEEPLPVLLPNNTYLDPEDVETVAWELMEKKEGTYLQNGMVFDRHPITGDLLLIYGHKYEDWKDYMADCMDERL